MKITKVIFLIEKDSEGDVFALFPEEIFSTDEKVDFLTCYAPIGQHSACHPNYVRECKEAEPEQYSDLLKELKGQGYDNLQVISEYELQAILFLQETGTTFTATFKEHGSYFTGEKDTRDVFTCVLKNSQHRYRFNFGQSIAQSTGNGSKPPTAYNVLASLTKYDCGSFENFCGDFGYDTDSRSAYKTYKAVKREWENVKRLWTPEEIERLQEIN